MRKFAAFDIDGTLIRWQLYHAIVTQLAKSGQIPQAAYEKIRKSRMQWKFRKHSESFKDYEAALVSSYHAAITALDIESYLQAVDSVFEEHKDQVYTYTRDLIKDLKDQGYLLLAVSGSQQEVITKLADYYGFDDAVGNTYERKAGLFTGRHDNIVENKAAVLDGLVRKHNATYKESVAVGDSESDAPMLSAVEKPIAFNPTQGLLARAKRQSWPIVIERKNVVYEIRPSGNGYTLSG